MSVGTYVGHYVNGDFIYPNDEKLFISVSPYNDQVVKLDNITPEFSNASNSTVQCAVGCARMAFWDWRELSRIKRAEYLDTLAQIIKSNINKLRDTISAETGKNLNESFAEVNEMLHMIQYSAAQGREPMGRVLASEVAAKETTVTRKPKGVVAIISPFNFPAAIGSTWCAGPALLEGNTVVHKCSELTPVTNHLIAKLYDEAGFPKGVYNLIHGDGQSGKYLVESDVDVILFTGSAEVGMEIRKHCATKWNKTASIETGSKSAVIVFEDGDLDLAVEASIASAFKLTGQRCVSASRILVQRSVLDKFKAKFLEKASVITAGNPFDGNHYCGPIITYESLERVEHYAKMIHDDQDAKVLLYNKRVAGKGSFFNPMVFECEWNHDKKFLVEEIFGPVVGIIPFDAVCDAISIHNDTPFGLAAGAITSDSSTARQLREYLNVGMLYINGGSIAAESHNLFGGVGKSGNGCKSAAGTYRTVTTEIVTTTNYAKGQLQFAQGLK